MGKLTKVIALLCVLVLLVSSLAACGGKGELAGGEEGTVFVDQQPNDTKASDKNKKEPEATTAASGNKVSTTKKPVAEQGAPTKNFEAYGMTIRLPELFQQLQVPGTVGYFENKQDNIAIGVRKQEFDDEWNATSSLNTYVKKYCKQYDVPSSASVLTPRGNYSYISYDTTVEEFTYFCVTGFWMGSDGIWSVTFICEKRYENVLEQLMLDWADTVKVK